MKRLNLLRRAAAFAAGALIAAGLAIPALGTPVKAADSVDMNVALCFFSFGNAGTVEKGDTVKVTGDGQYTVEFDCAKNLSDDAKAAGDTAITSFVAMYIQDVATLDGTASESPVATADIVYNSIKIDDKELTIADTNPASAVKASGAFDTNKPVNGWDGSVVADTDIVWDKTSHLVKFAGVDSVQKVSVTFTLSNVTAKAIETQAQTEEETTMEETTAAAETTAAPAAAADEGTNFPVGARVGIVAGVVVIVVVVIVVCTKKKNK